MAPLETPDSNILEAEAVNWRLVVYPIVGALVLLFGGCGIYFYLQSARAEKETAARQAFLGARTPAALLDVAGQFPGTTQGATALIAAGNLSFDQKDYATAQKEYQRVVDASGLDAELRDAARLGLASALEASGTSDSEAADTYLIVARRGHESPYAPYAYMAAAHVYERQHNKDKERQVLLQASSLGGDSPFTQEAQRLLQALDTAPAR